MKLNRALGISLIVAATAFAQAQDTFTIRRIFTEGEIDTYKLATSSETVVDVSAFGQGTQTTKFEQTGKVSYKTKKVDKEKGEAEMEIRYFDMDMKMDGGMPGAGGEMPKEYTVMTTFDSMNRMKAMKIEGLPGMARMMMESSMRQMIGGVQFPEKAVKVGDTWDIKMEKDGMMFATDQILKAKFLSVKEVSGKKHLELSIKGPLEMTMDLSKMMEEAGGENPMAGMKMNIGGKIDTDTVITIDAATGKLVMIDAKANTDMAVEMVDMGMKLPMTGKTTTIMKADEKK